MKEQDRKKSRWSMIVASLALVLIVYALSFGPAMWYAWDRGAIFPRLSPLDKALIRFYSPITYLGDWGPQWLRRWISWYGDYWMPGALELNHLEWK